MNSQNRPILSFALGRGSHPTFIQYSGLFIPNPMGGHEGFKETHRSRPAAGCHQQSLGVRRLDDFMRHSFKVMHDELYMVKVRISSAWARWVGEKIWHESQKAKKNGDGSLDLTFQLAGLDEIKRWILSFGPEAAVLEPEKLKEMVRKDLSRNLAQYSTGPIAVRSMKEIRAS